MCPLSGGNLPFSTYTALGRHRQRLQGPVLPHHRESGSADTEQGTRVSRTVGL